MLNFIYTRLDVRIVLLSLRVVGGVDVLSTMEKVETDSKDTPLEEIRIDKTVVFVDPFEEADRQVCSREDLTHANRGWDKTLKLCDYWKEPKKTYQATFTIQQLIPAIVPLQSITDKYENEKNNKVCHI